MSTQESGGKKQGNIVKIIKAPIRAISKVLNQYVKCVTNFSNVYNRPIRTAVEVSPDHHRLPRSFTASRLPDNDQPPESPLVRSISAGATDDRATNMKLTNFELYIVERHRQQLQSCASSKSTPRSCSVGMKKIDEDRASSFRDDNIVLRNKLYLKGDDSFSSKRRIDDQVPVERSRFV